MIKNTLNALAYVIIFLAVQVTAGMIATAVFSLLAKEAVTTLTPSQMVATQAFSGVLAIIVFATTRWGKARLDWIASRQWTALAWCIVAAIGTLIPSLWLQQHMPDLPEAWQRIADESEQQMLLLMQARGGYAVLALLVPVAEELVFRGAALRTLLQGREDRSPWLPIVVSALLFALAHLNPAQMPHAFLMGLLLGWLYNRSGSILPGIVVHWVNNTLAFFLTRLYPDPDVQLEDIFSGGASTVMLAVAFSLLILLPALFQISQNLRK